MADGAIIRRMGALVFDAVFEETHDSELSVTDNPVETGVVISDHAFMLPLGLNINAGVSDSPLHETFNDPYSGNKRSVKAYELLTALQRSAEPFDVQTGLKLYRNMVCQKITTLQDKESAGALIFSAQLREVIIVKTEQVKYKSRTVKSDANAATGNSSSGNTVTDKQATPRAGATARQASPAVVRGEVKGNTVTKTERKSSLLYRVTHI